MRDLGRAFRLLLILLLVPILMAMSAAPLQRFVHANDMTFGTLIGMVLVGCTVLFFGAKVLRLVWRILRWLFTRRRKAKPAASAKPVAPPVARVVQSPTRETARALPAPIADFLNK